MKYRFGAAPAWVLGATCLVFQANAEDATSALTATCTLAPQHLPAVLVPEAYSSLTTVDKTVRLSVDVAPDGSARSAKVLDSSRVLVFDQQAQATARQWGYLCRGKGGHAVVDVIFPAPTCRLNDASVKAHRPQLQKKDATGLGPKTVSLRVRPRSDALDRTEVQMTSSSGIASVDDAVMSAARQWRVDCAPDAPQQQPWITHFELIMSPVAKKPTPASSVRPKPVQQFVVDDSSMEFDSVQEYQQRLPTLKGVSARTDQATPPGVTLYADSVDAVWDAAMKGKGLVEGRRTSWVLMLPPHESGPAVVRTQMDAETGSDGVSRVTTRIGMLCEATEEVCAEVRRRRYEMIEIMQPEVP